MRKKKISPSLEDDLIRGMQLILNTDQCLEFLTENSNKNITIEDVERLINLIEEKYLPLLEEYKDFQGAPAVIKLHKANKSYFEKEYKIPA